MSGNRFYRLNPALCYKDTPNLVLDLFTEDASSKSLYSQRESHTVFLHNIPSCDSFEVRNSNHFHWPIAFPKRSVETFANGFSRKQCEQVSLPKWASFDLNFKGSPARRFRSICNQVRRRANELDCGRQFRPMTWPKGSNAKTLVKWSPNLDPVLGSLSAAL